ncbi:YscO family type III secretion system apparatus protein [Candidatus Protochlamydia phocaeensis]|uniref:YscO family type III secretion system apparatus protein n=1 Tax=Candidatus Protochlamydia phocaeensis TaxID=1414722 RepID=UPI000838BEDE|nr:YscO family type III secretion system apparatus protein [Candidatus Protochlamydia phocaeensis]
MNNVVYPLKQVIDVKQRRVDEAEKVVREKQQILEGEKQKLAEREAERDKVKKHYQDKLKQLRDTIDQGTTSPKIQQMKVYIKVVDEKLKVEEKKVKDQQEQVDLAQKNLDKAKEDLRIKRQEVDKLLNHKKDWEKEMRKELEIIEGREQDELGSIIYVSNHHRNR